MVLHDGSASARVRVAAIVGVIAAAIVGVSANSWPQFRGPGGRGIAEGANLPERWSATENVAWKTTVAGTGWSSPIVINERVIVTSVVSASETEKPTKGLYFGGERPASTAEHRWIVSALDLATGRLVWSHEAHRAAPAFARHLKNSYASETPVTDGQRVYVRFGNIGLFCYDLDGKLLWSQKAEPLRMRNGWGTASSPIYHDGRLYLVNDNDEQSFVTALDARTGKTVWRVPRDEGSNWSTPFIWQHKQRAELVTTGSQKVRSYALDGQLLWELRGMSSIAIPTPFTAHDLLYISSGYVGDTHRPAYAIRPGASGDITVGEPNSQKFVAWYQPQGGVHLVSPLVYQGQMYICADNGVISVFDAASGNRLYRARLGSGGSYYASPIGVNGHVLFFNQVGEAYAIKAGPKYELASQNSVGEVVMATPAVADGVLFVRGYKTLFAIGEPPAK
ncbi:MAG: PQQ-binding-like beta-propeller repeat protein [Vicinamibacterales bacterium]